MPSPKDGNPGTIVPPAAPKEAHDADDADPGQVESVKAGQRETKKGKYGKSDVKPFKKPQTPEEKQAAKEEGKTSWIEIVLVDEDGQPVPGEMYRITLPDESVAEGTLDGDGFARVESVPEGECKVTFPNWDQDAWSKND